ncbi:hypothetical protein QCA50_002212 [Cerrena zonata]|uniref:Molybdopterin cofactor biosynthesis C (MoaC) domain-containing protein n=1 Tax=Cerrena zonata TaxID=2478898 RepID=A0AAW0GT38_9APHY
MVNVSGKANTKRSATASGRIHIPKVAYNLIAFPGVPDDTSDVNFNKSATQIGTEKARSKGNVLTVAQLAAIMGCKRTSELIPLCHPLSLSHIAVSLRLEASRPTTQQQSPELVGSSEFGTVSRDLNLEDRSPYSIVCEATVSCEGKTGVEMEALTAVSVGLLTVWDMLKAVAGREMVIGDIFIQRKEGGKSGDFVRPRP